MGNELSPSKQALAEALELSSEILRNLELSEMPLENIALKTVRLARLLNDSEIQEIMQYEVSGYPSTPDGIEPRIQQLVERANRIYVQRDTSTKKAKQVVLLGSISQLEHLIRSSEIALGAAKDPSISISSANPHQYVSGGIVNREERRWFQEMISLSSARLATRRGFIYQYVLQRHYELKYSGIVDDIFTRIRDRVDGQIGMVVPGAIKKLSAVYESLASDNPENWANAVHSCRRILQELADAVFPLTDESRTTWVNGKEQQIKLGQDHYTNRIIAFVEDNSDSDRFEEIVGSHLKYLGERLDSVFQAAQKGSHSEVVSRQEADRYVIYTYLLVGDILSLRR
jgi:hypothetical protein